MSQSPGPTSSAAASLARTSATPANESESKEAGPVFGASSLASFAFYDRGSCSLKTSQLSLLVDLSGSSVTLPSSGTMRNGRLFARPTSEHPINENGSSYLPTPCATTAGYNRGGGMGRVGPIRPTLRMM